LPHWITIGIASLFGRCDQVWIVRIPPALMGLVSVLLLAWMAAGWYGREIGALSGLILGTMFEFTRYAWMAEEDVFLAAIVLATLALFVHLEFFRAPRQAVERNWFWSRRPWPVLAFFLVLGMTNLVKGLLFGAAMVLVPVAGFLIWNADLRRIARYVWLWGWLVFAVAALGWIAVAMRQYPDMLQIWFRDVTDRTEGIRWSEPVWKYWVDILWSIAPWTPAALYGLWLTRGKAFGERASADRFLWCWSLLTLAFLSTASHKHHHYLVPCLAPWAVLGAIGSVRIWQQVGTWPAWQRSQWLPLGAVALPAMVAVSLFGARLPGPSWLVPALLAGIPVSVFGVSWAIAQRNGRWATGVLFGLLGGLYLCGHTYSGRYVDTYRDDTVFLQHVRQLVPTNQPVFVNSQGAHLNMFRHMFYLGDNARMLHNLSFLRDQRIRESEVYVVTRYHDEQKLAELGAPTAVLESKFHRPREPADMRWALFRVKLRDDLDRHSAEGVHYTALQVMEREPGPYLGKPL
jgi:4-amino-4-deoxy-L-arabinose transferase-like glycosyltransferase